MSEPTASRIETEVRRRRTFAIISHPDAGKTTLTLQVIAEMQKLAGVLL